MEEKQVTKKDDEKLGRIAPAGVFIEPGSGMGGTEIEGPLEVIFAGLIGAMAGFVVGLLVGSIVRVLTINSVKGTSGGIHWAAYGACAGTVAMVVMALIT